jgi:hypothetical protein
LQWVRTFTSFKKKCISNVCTKLSQNKKLKDWIFECTFFVAKSQMTHSPLSVTAAKSVPWVCQLQCIEDVPFFAVFTNRRQFQSTFISNNSIKRKRKRKKRGLTKLKFNAFAMK